MPSTEGIFKARRNGVDVLTVDDNDAVITNEHIGPILAESRLSLPAVSTNSLIHK